MCSEAVRRCGIQSGLLKLSVWCDAPVLSDYIFTFAHAEMFKRRQGGTRSMRCHLRAWLSLPSKVHAALLGPWRGG